MHLGNQPSTACDSCAAGQHTLDCENCPNNTWSKPGVGQTCDECKVDYYRVGDACELCNPYMVCETTDVTLENFKCIAGYYRKGDVCKKCKGGMKCDADGVI